MKDRLDVADQALLAGIEGLTLDQPGAGLAFSDRLARENGWSKAYAERVVAEYRRFVFLAAAAGHPVTPSEEVDQAWHLHLVYTRSYWDELCGEVLGFPLHHGPTVGGPAEGAKFTDWYQRTLDSYQRLLGTEPPVDIWPPPRQRFANADRFRRINTAEHWVVPKPAVVTSGGSASLRVPLLGLGALVVSGCATAAGSNPAILGASFLAASAGSIAAGVVLFGVLGIVVLFALYLIAQVVRAVRNAGGSGSSRSGAGCGVFGPSMLGDSDDGGGGGDAGCGGGGCGGAGCGGGA